MRNGEIAQVDLEGYHQQSDASGDESACFSDVEDGSCHSQFHSTAGGSYDEHSFACGSDREIAGGSGSQRLSTGSERSVDALEIEVVRETKVHLRKVERDCRICHLGLESNSHESGVAIELGCSCKDDLAAAHKNCAETWFKIRGNRTCEICQSIASNVAGADIEAAEQSNETSGATATSAVLALPPAEIRSFWHGHRLLNFLLACMVFAFVISWLFHFKMPSS